MKFIHKISKITSYIIQICLLIAVLTSSGLASIQLGKVAFLRSVKNRYEFQLLVRNPNITFKNAEAFYQEKCHAKGLMTGIATFIPKGGEGLPAGVYVAQKAPGDSTANHDPDTNGHPLMLSFREHTERLLLATLAAIQARISIDDLYKEEFFNNTSDIDAKLEKIEGEFHIFLKAGPCSKRDKGNNNFSCIEYYQKLQEKLPKCKFHIYFQTMSLNKKIRPNPKQMHASLTGVVRILEKSVIRNDYLPIVGLRDNTDNNRERVAKLLTEITTMSDGAALGKNYLATTDYYYNIIPSPEDELITAIMPTFKTVPLGRYNPSDIKGQIMTIIPAVQNAISFNKAFKDIMENKSPSNINIRVKDDNTSKRSNYFQVTMDNKAAILQYDHSRSRKGDWKEVILTDLNNSSQGNEWTSILARVQTMVNDFQISNREDIVGEAYPIPNIIFHAVNGDIKN